MFPPKLSNKNLDKTLHRSLETHLIDTIIVPLRLGSKDRYVSALHI